MTELRQITQEELNEILQLHKMWLNDGKGGKKANLSSADLSGADLRGADLRSANLRSADLRGADLCSANLRGANLSSADLSGADLRSANLRGANLSSADLRSADLRGADLCSANLRGANLSSANLRGANLCSANLRGADLDFSCFPLWCGSLDMKTDGRLFYQLVYHICRLDCDLPEFKKFVKQNAKIANKFHRVEECGEIKVEVKEKKEQKADELDK